MLEDSPQDEYAAIYCNVSFDNSLNSRTTADNPQVMYAVPFLQDVVNTYCTADYSCVAAKLENLCSLSTTPFISHEVLIHLRGFLNDRNQNSAPKQYTSTSGGGACAAALL